MSSVVISGDVSGSVTLQAPSAAGTTVLTLPATSGTVVTTATSSGISGSAITTGTVGVSVGGTGQTTASAAFNALSPITTTGDLIIGNGANSATRLAIGSSNTVLTSNGTTATWAAAGGGQLQTEIFTSPGTWTKPSSCTQVRVTVIGAGGGGAGGGVPAGSPGGTSSFGPAVSATGGAGSPGSGAGGSGSGTVSGGTALNTYDVSLGIPATSPSANSNVFLGVLSGSSIRPAQPGAPKASTAYTTSSTFIAGARGLGVPSGECGGAGGYATAIVPVSAPVTVTIGAGGSGGGPTGPGISGGVNGAVLVEFVG